MPQGGYKNFGSLWHGCTNHMCSEPLQVCLYTMHAQHMHLHSHSFLECLISPQREYVVPHIPEQLLVLPPRCHSLKDLRYYIRHIYERRVCFSENCVLLNLVNAENLPSFSFPA